MRMAVREELRSLQVTHLQMTNDFGFWCGVLVAMMKAIGQEMIITLMMLKVHLYGVLQCGKCLLSLVCSSRASPKIRAEFKSYHIFTFGKVTSVWRMSKGG